MTEIWSDDATPALAAMYRMQWEAAQNAWVLLYPEGMVRLNDSAAEILRRCDGHTRVAALIEDLQQAFGEADLRGDVLIFLGDARDHGWLG